MATIALDYDGTFTAMPEIWRRFISDAFEHGHRVLIVSSRPCECSEDHYPCENHADLRSDTNCISIILTSGSAKKWFMEQRGVKVDIWIDDCPESILQGK